MLTLTWPRTPLPLLASVSNPGTPPPPLRANVICISPLSFFYQRRDVHLKEGWRRGDHGLYELVLQDIRRAMVDIWLKCRNPQSDQELEVASSYDIYNKLDRFLYAEKKGKKLSPRVRWEKSGGRVEDGLLIGGGGTLPQRDLVMDISACVCHKGYKSSMRPETMLEKHCDCGVNPPGLATNPQFFTVGFL